MTTAIRAGDREDIIQAVADADDLDVRWESVVGRYVRCPEPDVKRGVCPDDPRMVFYALADGGGHGHYREFETPHRRLVVRLPVEPGSAD